MLWLVDIVLGTSHHLVSANWRNWRQFGETEEHEFEGDNDNEAGDVVGDSKS